MNTIDPKSLGAKADGQTNDTAAVQAAIDQAAEAGGVVRFSAGTYCTGTIYLKSNVTVIVPAGSVWEAVTDLEYFPFIEPNIRSRMDTQAWRAFIYAFDQENITLRGDGLIHGRGDHEVFQNGVGNSPERPYGLHIVGCRNVLVEGLNLKNSAFWMQRYLHCDGVTLRGLKVFNHSNLNNDGVDIDSSRNVVVSDCIIDSSDDALCFKSEGAPPCEHVTATNCVLRSFASPLKFGTGSIGGFRNMVVSNMVIHEPAVENTTHGLGSTGGLAGIDIGVVDGGVMENVSISNVVMEDVETPIFIKLGDRQSRRDGPGPWPDAPPERPGVIRNVRITNVTANGVGPIASAIVGYEGNPISGVVLSGISINATRPPKQVHDWDVELHAKLYPMNRIFNSDLPAYGFYIAHARDIIISDLALKGPEDDERPAIGFESSKRVRLRSVDAEARPEQAIQLRNSEAITLDGAEI